MAKRSKKKKKIDWIDVLLKWTVIIALVWLGVNVARAEELKFSPRIGGGFNVGGNAQGLMGKFSVGNSMYSYGTNWRFLQFGMDFNTSTAGLNLVPVLYRLDPEHMPNTFVGPGIGFDKDGINGFLNMSLGF